MPGAIYASASVCPEQCLIKYRDNLKMDFEDQLIGMKKVVGGKCKQM
jgi:hypothetical protein